MKKIYPFESFAFKHPFTAFVSGCTGCGKTEWLIRFLASLNLSVLPPIQNILYCYSENHKKIPIIQSLGIQVYKGIPSEDDIKSLGPNGLLIIDDLVGSIKPDFLESLYTKISHHSDISIITLTQHAFHNKIRMSRSNSHYLVLMKNPAGELQIRNLGVQLFPKKLNFFLDAYKDATKDNYGYLLVDLHPSTPEEFRLRTYIFPDEYQKVYSE